MATVTPWLLYLASFVEAFTPAMLVDFTAYRENSLLEPWEHFVRFDSLGALLLDRLDGVLIAFSPTHAEAYVRSFGPIVYLIPLAAVLAVMRLRRFRVASGLAPEWLLPCAAGLAAVLSLAPVHMLHTGETNPFGWWFHWRHGLPMFFALMVAMPLLTSRGKLARATAICAALASLVISLPAFLATTELHHPAPSRQEIRLVQWLEEQTPSPLLIGSHARQWAALGDVRMHNVACRDDVEHTRTMLREFDIDYIVAFEWEWRSCPHLRGLYRKFERVQSFGPRPMLEIWRWTDRRTDTGS